MTSTSPRSHRGPDAADLASLGARYSMLTHAVLHWSDTVIDGVYLRPVGVDDERAAGYAALVATVRDQAVALDDMSVLIGHLPGSAAHTFFAGLHADNMARLDRQWELAFDRLRWPAQRINAKASRELEREPRHRYCVEPDELSGGFYADLTYWAVHAMQELHLSSLYPGRHKGNDEASLRNDIRNARAILRDVQDTGAQFLAMAPEQLLLVLPDLDAKTRLRTRLFADDVLGRVRPLLARQDSTHLEVADRAASAQDPWAGHPVEHREEAPF